MQLAHPADADQADADVVAGGGGWLGHQWSPPWMSSVRAAAEAVPRAAASRVESEPMPTKVQPCPRRRWAAAPSPTGRPQALPWPGGGGADRLQRLQVGRGGDVAGDAEVVAEVAGPTNSTSTPSMAAMASAWAGRGRLDLNHAQHLAVGAVKRARVEAEAAGPVVGGDAAVAPRLVARVPHGRGDRGGQAQPGQHHPGRAQVEHPAEADAGVGLDPDHGQDAVGAGGQDGGADLLLTAAAVLQVEQHPVGPGGGADLGRHRRGHAQEDPDGRLPRGQAGRSRPASSGVRAGAVPVAVIRTTLEGQPLLVLGPQLGHARLVSRGRGHVPPDAGAGQVGVGDGRDHDHHRAGVVAGVGEGVADFLGHVRWPGPSSRRPPGPGRP